MTALVVFCAQYLIVLPPVALGAWFLFSRNISWRAVWLAVISIPLTYLIGKAAGLLWYDPQPFVVSHTAPLFAHAVDNGFPSDHMLIAAACASVAFALNKKVGLALWLVAVIIGAARVYAGVHHLIDIVAAALIAIAVTFIVDFFLARFFTRA